MKNSFKKIYLSWRPSKGLSRLMVGEIIIHAEVINFRYIKEELNKATKLGFSGYPGLPIDKPEHLASLDLFIKRLINTDRSDAEFLLNFWEIDSNYKEDKLYLLAMTQGIMQTDNFEFLANFELKEGLTFVSDVAGLSHSKFDLTKVKIGSELTFEKENHIKDKDAVKVLFKGELVGYIKKGHNQIFHEEGSLNIKIEVKHITNTKVFKELYVKIYSDSSK
ncbi:hypothetical protein CLV62_11870 [Dysgonomonas alginatilytica]|uniref:HIRAN domain-containing protein n=1 Tax=Dysgonomonas alginatilytica TaxID=1605892 RepID=A0A2V3PLP2_9BACT|nr:hypothetical protein [Dysgonomonas alginatilytica]PXV62681.1 hypothetical protein CLV62_11870 [Dysgonomonas alginatilytica]